MMFKGFRIWSSVGTGTCQGEVGVRGGTGSRLCGSIAGRPCTTSASSGVPRPVARAGVPAPPRPPPPPPPPPPPAPPRPPPPRVLLTPRLIPSALYIARLSGTPYAIGLVSSASLV